MFFLSSVEAHGSYRIINGSAELERHGDRDVAARRLAEMVAREAAQPESRAAAEGGAKVIPGVPAGEDAGEVARLKSLLQGNVQETVKMIKDVTSISELAALKAVEEATAKRKTVLGAIDKHCEALSQPEPAGEA